jgi:predicted GIY-YIG superfamily endonuclease
MYYVYILLCGDRSLYTGITNDLVKRLAAHKAGTASRYTRSRGAIKFVYQESCANRSHAQKRESEIKSFTKRQKLELAKDWNKWKNAVIS